MARPSTPPPSPSARGSARVADWGRPLGLLLMFLVVFTWWDAWIFWPLKIGVVALHELSHALATWLTGGEVVGFGLGLDQSGHVLSRGGSRFLILNAGYLGSLGFGLLLLLASRRPGWDLRRFAMRFFGLFSVLYALVDVRDDVLFGSGVSDATLLAELTHVPALLWGLAWIGAGVAVLWALRRPLFFP